MKRPTEVQQAEDREIAAEHAEEEQYRHEHRQRRASRQIECPAEGQGDRDHHAEIVERECRASAEPLG